MKLINLNSGNSTNYYVRPLFHKFWITAFIEHSLSDTYKDDDELFNKDSQEAKKLFVVLTGKDLSYLTWMPRIWEDKKYQLEVISRFFCHEQKNFKRILGFIAEHKPPCTCTPDFDAENCGASNCPNPFDIFGDNSNE
jgi:hypothetical protein